MVHNWNIIKRKTGVTSDMRRGQEVLKLTNSWLTLASVKKAETANTMNEMLSVNSIGGYKAIQYSWLTSGFYEEKSTKMQKWKNQDLILATAISQKLVKQDLTVIWIWRMLLTTTSFKLWEWGVYGPCGNFVRAVVCGLCGWLEAVARKRPSTGVTNRFCGCYGVPFGRVCYAEFAARVPKAGSAYIYSYVSVGELAAFIIGWNLILEYVIGTASVARGLSNYVDNLLDYAMKNALTEAFPINISFLSPYPDFLSCGFVLVQSLILAWGVKESTLLNNLFTSVNLLTVITVIVCGCWKADISNWMIKKENIPPNVKGGEGGFMPFGVPGIMAGAAKCFYGFVGFDCVATTGEEAKNPQKNIPLSIILSLIIIFLSYFGIATVITMMYPYYLQDPDAPLPFAFGEVGLPAVKIAVTVGAIFALCTSMLGAMFPLPRVLYAMSHDGLLYEFMSRIHPVTKTPVLATLLSGVFAGIMAAMFNLDQLIDMMSIGTLLAYTIVAICVLVLRYRDPNPVMYERPIMEIQNGMNGHKQKATTMGNINQLFNLTMMKYPNSTTELVAAWAITILILFIAGTCLCLIYFEEALANGEAWAFIAVAIMTAASLVTLYILHRQPQNNTPLTFKVPAVPLIPALSIFMNSYLMLKLDLHTWIRFGIWLFIGMIIYITYSIPNSVEGIKDRISAAERKPPKVPKRPTTDVTKF
ncbi:hypothetical protein LSTR_LSTR008554 [Laodelphax striatellus]|uniref:Cationic amino acid transporter C-terminal domain-containing protein n=1 Tax=Laodelphax striatellus TaxID=195883 RepID=A0A482XSD1_LAOST|nr:hypothetical protein LSTR_LSTR008554 [Laodelphax striatellus]